MDDNTCVIFFGGLIFLQYIVKILKSCFKQSRPIESNTYGMPSTKSATLSYISTFLIINNNNIKLETQIKLVIFTMIGFLYKLYYHEHSTNQIICGTVIGIIYAYLIKLYINNK